jgi:hypothetical protein
MRPTPWRDIVRWSLIGAAVGIVAVFVSLENSGGNPVALINPGERGPSAAAVHEDFPRLELPDDLGHDGQQFYAIARNPLHPDEVADSLDRPRYRLQRIAYPLAAWALHPTGGGLGLVYALLAVGVAALFAGGLATGALTTGQGLPPWCAAIGAALPGSVVAVRLSTADSLAIGAMVAALALAERRRVLFAVLAGCVAVLAKEAVLVSLLAYLVHRRNRDAALVFAMPAAVTAAWWAWLHVAVDARGAQVIEFTLPFRGLASAASSWLDGDDPWAALIMIVTVVLTIAALTVVDRGRLWWTLVAINAAFITVLSADATGLWANSTRVLAPLMLFATLGLIERATHVRRPGASPA